MLSFGVHVDEGFGLLLFGAFSHKLDFLFRQLKWKNSSLIPFFFFFFFFTFSARF